METKKFYITTAIDYTNGNPHIGHAYEKVAADVLARWHKLRGEDVFFLTGTDEHGAKIAAAAEKAGKAPQEFTDEIAAKFQKTWQNLEISPSRFIRTTDEDHVKTVGEILQKIKDNGYLYEGEYTGLYCVGHEAFITEKELVNGVCPDHKTKPEVVKEKNWFFEVSAFTGDIKKRIERSEGDENGEGAVSGGLKIWPEQKRNEILSWLEQGFTDVSVTRPNVKWAIPAPWDPEQTVYVWIDALINYLSGAGFVLDRGEFERYWPADVHVIGADIVKFHCIIWPAMLLAAGMELPKEVVVHGMFTVNGEKMSKSLGNVIDPNGWVLKYGADAVRYLLMREVPWGQDGDVSEEKLLARYEGDLANGLGNLVSRTTNMIEKYCDGQVPEILRESDLPESALSPLQEVGALIEELRFHEALAKIWESIAWANQYIDGAKPWVLAKTDLKKTREILSLLSAHILAVAHKLAPFLPHTAERMRKTFESGKIGKINDLFPRIE